MPRAKRRLIGPRLDDALRDRRSQRGPFASRSLLLTELGALLDLAVGASRQAPSKETKGQEPPEPRDLRPFPSAGALYPVEVYLAALSCASVERGIHHYDAFKHALASVAPCPAPGDLARLIFADDLWQGAAAALIFTGVFQAKYGERGYRFALLEAGHAAQNVLLVAQSLGLAAAPIGGFCEDTLGAAMGLDATRESPVYVILVGGRDRPR